MQLTSNTRAFIEAEVLSDVIITNIHDGLLGESFYRNISDFNSGDQLNIRTVGTVTLQEGEENVAGVYNPIDTGTISLSITDSLIDAWYITDELREDGTNVEALQTARALESTRAFQEAFETSALDTACSYYAAGGTGAGSPNLINGHPHLIPSTGSNGAFQLSQLVKARLSFKKAKVPNEGNIAIVDPVVEATLNSLVTLTSDISGFAKEVLASGLSSGMQFVTRLYGFDIMTSNYLKVATYSDGTTSISNGVGNLVMNVLDDNLKPIMVAWRRQPRVEGERNIKLRRDEFTATARWGTALQRVDTLACLPTSSTAITNA